MKTRVSSPSRWLTAIAVSLLGVGPLAQAARRRTPPKPITIELLLSNGERRAGEVSRSDDTRVILRVKRRLRTVYVRNIVQYSLQLPDEDQAKLAGLEGAKKDVAIGKILLERRFLGLAARKFADALGADEAMKDEIKSAYQAGKLPVPEEFGGPPPKDPRLKKQPRRYILPTPEQIEHATKKAKEWGDKMKLIAPKTHVIETKHFRIYSSWSRADDRKLQQIYTSLYSAMCRQFSIPPYENIWIGKLAVYAFWKKENFVRFSVDVADKPMEIDSKVGGYAGSAGSRRKRHRYVVLGPIMLEGMSKSHARTWFFELLVHESAHAFIGRFINEKSIVNWVNEGIAEIMASTLVRGAGAERKFKTATREVAKTGRSIEGVFVKQGNIPLDSFHYGIAQSLTRYLVHKDKKKFIRFVKLLKEGKDDEEALQEVFGLTHATLTKAWKRATRR